MTDQWESNRYGKMRLKQQHPPCRVTIYPIHQCKTEILWQVNKIGIGRLTRWGSAIIVEHIRLI